MDVHPELLRFIEEVKDGRAEVPSRAEEHM
jgi:hypothetical protein